MHSGLLECNEHYWLSKTLNVMQENYKLQWDVINWVNDISDSGTFAIYQCWVTLIYILYFQLPTFSNLKFENWNLEIEIVETVPWTSQDNLCFWRVSFLLTISISYKDHRWWPIHVITKIFKLKTPKIVDNH